VRVLLIDYYDSYTSSLVHLLLEAGASHVTTVGHDSPQLEALLSTISAIQEQYQLIVLAPGPGNPHDLLQASHTARVLAAPLPMWGIGLGHQLIALHAGASSTQDRRPCHGQVSHVHHTEEGMWAGIPNGTPVARFHSWSVQTPLPAALRVTAETTENAENTVMAFAGHHHNTPRWGTQFQPESLDTPAGLDIARNILGLAQRWNSSAVTGLDTTQVVEVLRRFRTDNEHLRCLDDSLLERTGTVSRDSHWGSIITLCSNDRIVGDGEALAQVEARLGERVAAAPGAFSGWIGAINYEGDYVDFAHTTIAVTGSSHGWTVAGDDPTRVQAVKEALAAASDAAADDAPAGNTAADSAEVSFQTELFGPDKGTYRKLFDTVQKLLHAGDSYEVCLTDRFRVPRYATHTPWETFLRLRHICPTHFGAYLELADRTVVSASPELFLKTTPSGSVVTRPMKGTARRHPHNPQQDAAAAAALANDPKTRAENLMAIDLARSDLAQVCKPGTVHVSRDRVVESFETVHQLVSEVTGVLAPDKTPFDAVRTCWPPASMTGAPKAQTVEHLRHMEQQPRDIYSGVVGFITDAGEAEFSVVIRTAIFDKEEVTIGAGGAITIDSTLDEEFTELHHKASYVVKACVDSDKLVAQAPVVDSFYWCNGHQIDQQHQSKHPHQSGLADDTLSRKLHQERFVDAVKQLYGPTQHQAAQQFYDQCLQQLPQEGEYFPRIAWTARGGEADLERPCPKRLTDITATLADLPDGRYLPTIKGPDMPALAVLRQDASDRGADEIVFGDRWGNVVEGTHSAILWWEGDTLCGPPKHAVLPSTMRELYEHVMRQQGHPVVEKWLPLRELPNYRVVSVNALHGVRTITNWV